MEFPSFGFCLASVGTCSAGGGGGEPAAAAFSQNSKKQCTHSEGSV